VSLRAYQGVRDDMDGRSKSHPSASVRHGFASVPTDDLSPKLHLR
jgi:hypothetical protein